LSPWDFAPGSKGDLAANLAGLMAPVAEAAAEIAILQDPRHLYMRCVACGLIR
jgi:hypothetical protein